MPLTAIKINKAKPDAKKPLRLFDGRGLYLEIAPSGGKWWRFKYRISGKEKRLSLGVYSAAGSKTVEVSLEAARKAAEDARQLVRNGVDPSQERKAENRSCALRTSRKPPLRLWRVSGTASKRPDGFPPTRSASCGAWKGTSSRVSDRCRLQRLRPLSC